jgi:hypothetical protein
LIEALTRPRRGGPPPLPGAARGIVELVQVTGRLAPGQPIDARADAVLTDDALELRAPQTGQVLARFAFADPAVCVAGTSERFIVAGDTAGPVAVSGGAERFRERLVRSEAVRAAAQRTTANGPYPAFVENSPVVCRDRDEGLEVEGAAGGRTIPYAEVRGVSREVENGQEGLTVTVANGPPVRLTGERGVLYALATAVRARLVARTHGGRPGDLVAAILGLERDYFVYTLFGPLFELHAALSRRGEAGLDDPLPVPAATDDLLALAGAMAQGLAPMRNHLDKVAYYLPSMLVACDAAVCCAGGRMMPPWLKAHERNYRAVLAGVQPVAAELRMMRELLTRLRGVEARLRREADYGSAKLSLVLGATVNPLMLVSAANPAFAASKQTTRQKEEASEDARQSVERAVGQWNYLMLEFLPPLWHHILDGLFPMRMQLYARAQKQADGPTVVRLARRLAALATFVQYPEAEGSSLTRGSVTAAARRRRDRMSYAGFQPF